jgi:hypothetical protein
MFLQLKFLRIFQLLKAFVLRSLGRKKEAIELVSEIITFSAILPEETPFHGAALVLKGKLIFDEKDQKSKDEATKLFETCMKLPEFQWASTVKSQARSLLNQMGIEEVGAVEVDEKEEDKLMQDEDIKKLIETEQQQQDD